MKQYENFNYENKEYLEKLNKLPSSYYSKYILFLNKFLNDKSKFLDIGCGNGEVLLQLKQQGYENGYGLDISKLFVNKAKSRGLTNIYSYDGDKFPFKNNFFDLIGSFNVLEHTTDPEEFISSQINLLKKKGIIIIACPNFLSSVLLSPHPRVVGLKNKIINFLRILKKLINKSSKFETMPVIKRTPFQYDDDAVVVTNLLDIKRVLEANGCNVIYESGFINYDNSFAKIINLVPFIRYMLPSCFVVAQRG